MKPRLNLINLEIRYEQDVVATRQRARQIAEWAGLSVQEQTAFATAVSEIARNAFRYAGGGKVEFGVDPDPPTLLVHVRDKGPGIANLAAILQGRYSSQTGMGLGLIGAKRLCERFDVETTPGGGTTVVLGKPLPRRGAMPTPQAVAALTSDLARQTLADPLAEMQRQNKELMHALEISAARQAEVERLNAELAETNRGVLALYTELDEKAESLRKASEIKSRFLSDMSHELRTPLNAMVSLSGLLLARVDGELTAEQEKQVRFIRESAKSLGEIVNDLLDLAKIEAGKTELHVGEFQIADTLAAVRGMFRPLVAADSPVAMHVEEPHGITAMTSDEGKVAQILRNFVSNALKFTERGEVRVRAEAGPDGTIVFSVSDTGVGVAEADRERIFQDFAQVDGPIQRRARGTGLGLPLTRKLAALLGGTVSLHSRLGGGSTFFRHSPGRVPEAGGNG